MKYNIPFAIGDKVKVNAKVKKRVPCNICFDGELPIFGEVFICPKCKGKKKIDAYEEKEVESFIAQYNVQHYSAINTPRGYGIRNEEYLTSRYQLDYNDQRKKKIVEVRGVSLITPHDPIELDCPFDIDQTVYIAFNDRGSNQYQVIAEPLQGIYIQIDTRGTSFNYTVRNGYYNNNLFATEQEARTYVDQINSQRPTAYRR